MFDDFMEDKNKNAILDKPVEIRFNISRELHQSGNFGIYAINPIGNTDKYKYNSYGNVVIKGNLGKLFFDMEYKGLFQYKEDDNSQYDGAYELAGMVYLNGEISEDMIKSFLYSALTSMQADEVWREYPDIIDIVLEGREDEIDIDKLYNIGHVRIKSVIKKIKTNFANLNFINGLKDYGFSISEINDLSSVFSRVDEVIDKINNDPYHIYCFALGRSVSATDKIILKDRPEMRYNDTRVRIIFGKVISKISFNGSTLIDKNTVREGLRKDYPYIYEVFDELIENSKSIYVNGDYIGMQSLYDMEKWLFNTILSSNNKVTKVWDYDLEKYRDEEDLSMTDEQLGVITSVAKNIFTTLVGNSGSGKSTSVRSLIKYLKDTNKSFELMTPSGISSKVLSNYTGEPSATIHRALSYHPAKGFRRELVDVDVLIIDELSMVDIWLLYNLIKRIDLNNTRVVFVGDDSQLPSVQSGNILNDILEKQLCNIVKLTKVFRYTSNGLVRVATDSRNGLSWLNGWNQLVLGEDKDYVFMPTQDDEILQKVVNIFNYMLKNNDIEYIKVLSAYKNYDLGSNRINNVLKNIYNPSSDYDNTLKVGDRKFNKNDIVMNIQNNYEASGVNKPYDYIDEYQLYSDTVKMSIYNGEIGKVVNINETDKEIIVEFDDKFVVFDSGSIYNLEHSICLTVHKSQSATFKNVICVNPYSHRNFLSRNILYTAMTRTSHRLVQIGSPVAIETALEKSDHENRLTNIKLFDKNDFEEVEFKPIEVKGDLF